MKAKDPDFKVGQTVLLYTLHVQKGLSAKLQRKWKGPYYIVECCPNHTSSLTHADTHVLQKTLVHANRLNRPFSESRIPQGGKTQEQGGNTEQKENSPADETERPNSQPDLTVNEDIISRQLDHSIDKIRTTRPISN